MNVENLMSWFEREILPELAKRGHFSDSREEQKVSSCEFEAIQYGIDSFASVPCFAKLVLETSKGLSSRNVLIKFQSQDPIFREMMKTVRQFHNEVTMYNRVIPGFVEFLMIRHQNPDLITDVVPRCFYATDEGGVDENLVILEDLRQDGYKSAESKFELDLEHCLASVEQLAKFHAVSYAMKHHKWQGFEGLKNSFQHVWFEDEPMTREQCERFKGRVAQRGIDYLLANDSEVPKDYLDIIKNKLTNIFDVLLEQIAPTEPMSVICHGDFNRNNILFKYTNGSIHAKLFDFQTFVYSSPGIDLGFFMYMNTSQEFREKNFDNVLRHYHSVLVHTTSTIAGVPETEIETWLPYELLMKDFARVSLHAFVTVSFFLPFMMCPPKQSLDEDLKTKTFDQMAEETYSLGGEEVSKRISGILVDFYKRKFYM